MVSLVLLLATGVRADRTYSYAYAIIRMYVRIVTFDFSLKYVFHFFSRYLVVSSRYDCFFSVSITCGATHAGRILFDTKRKRENRSVWPFEVRVMMLLVRQIASEHGLFLRVHNKL